VSSGGVAPRPPNTGGAGLADGGGEAGQAVAWLGIAAAIVFGSRYLVKATTQRR
jgi:hypothetical protein